MVDDAGEVRDGQSAAPGLDAHGELVAETERRFAHSGQAEVFGEGGGYFRVDRPGRQTPSMA